MTLPICTVCGGFYRHGNHECKPMTRMSMLERLVFELQRRALIRQRVEAKRQARG